MMANELTDILKQHGIDIELYPWDLEKVKDLAQGITLDDGDIANVIESYIALKLNGTDIIKVEGVKVADKGFKEEMKGFLSRMVNKYINDWKVDEYVIGVHAHDRFSLRQLKHLALAVKYNRDYKKEVESIGFACREIGKILDVYARPNPTNEDRLTSWIDVVGKEHYCACIFDIISFFGGYYSRYKDYDNRQKCWAVSRFFKD